ncbi:MAG TPA: hypothetical protein VLV31_02975 [Candidatus Acidoferrales bacterium]|nr:hypothetical protein [Candidatus Acidoferrales bacterium]
MVSIKAVKRVGAGALVLPMGDHLISPILTMIFAPAIMSTMFGPGAIAAVVFFICLGLFQILCIGLILKSTNPYLMLVGILGNIASILIYFISTMGVTIYGVPPQPLIPFGVLIKALEAIFVVAAAYLITVRQTGREVSRNEQFEEEAVSV